VRVRVCVCVCVCVCVSVCGLLILLQILSHPSVSVLPPLWLTALTRALARDAAAFREAIHKRRGLQIRHNIVSNALSVQVRDTKRPSEGCLLM